MSTRDQILALAPHHYAAEIAKMVGVTKQRVSQILRSTGVKAAPNPRDDESLALARKKELERMVSEGYTRTEAAAAFGISKTALHDRQRRYGLTHLSFKSDQVNWTRIEEIKRLAEQGFTKTEIARKIGIASPHVTRYAIRFLPDVEFRDGRRK